METLSILSIPSITAITLVLTFLSDLIFRKTVEKRPFIVNKRKIHHNVLGLALLLAGILLKNGVILGIGLGMYLSHGFEEMYFNRTRLPRAFFVLVTRPRPRLPRARRSRTM
jgi:hypothetical protein